MNRLSGIAHVVTAIGVIIVIGFIAKARLNPTVNPPVGSGTSVVYATTTVSCKSGKQFIISTGNTGGQCKISETSGQVTTGSCGDGLNTAEANCNSNGGDGACGNTQGSGSCTPK